MRRLALLAGSLALLTAIGLAGSALAALPDLIVEATSPAGASVEFAPPLDDCSPESGSVFPLGSTAVTCTDSETQVSFNVIVQDTTAPAFAGVPGKLTFEATSPAGVDLAYTLPLAIDLVDSYRSVSCAPVPRTVFPIGETIVICSASDSRGNSASVSFSVVVRDTTPPVFDGKPPGAVKRVKGKRRARVVYERPIAIDAVDGEIRSVCSPRSGSVFKFGATTVACTATDSRGNQSTISFQVRVAKSGPDLLSPADGERITSPPLLKWTAVKSATYYNVQIYKNGRKILSLWPHSSGLQVTRSWTFEGNTHRLTAGTYTWYVWPGFGSLAAARYGNLIGQRSFVIR